jgi:hypothetical protein
VRGLHFSFAYSTLASFRNVGWAFFHKARAGATSTTRLAALRAAVTRARTFAPTCDNGKYIAVAVEVGTTTSENIRFICAPIPGGPSRYLHLDLSNLKVAVGHRVARGQPIGFVSDYFSATPTTIHVHFEIEEPVTESD